MPKNGIAGLTCPLCLGVDDPSGMLSVVIERQVPRAQAEVSICLRCVDAIAKGMAEFGRAEVTENGSDVESTTSDSSDSVDAGDRPGVTLDPAFASSPNEESTSGLPEGDSTTDGSNAKLI